MTTATYSAAIARSSDPWQSRSACRPRCQGAMVDREQNPHDACLQTINSRQHLPCANSPCSTERCRSTRPLGHKIASVQSHQPGQCHQTHHRVVLVRLMPNKCSLIRECRQDHLATPKRQSSKSSNSQCSSKRQRRHLRALRWHHHLMWLAVLRRGRRPRAVPLRATSALVWLYHVEMSVYWRCRRSVL